jgi:circadian clock protein KaiC
MPDEVMIDEEIRTGIPGLDRLLGGGIPRRHALVVTGPPGSGKTILASQIAFTKAAEGTSVVFATITSEPQDKIVEAQRSFRFFDSKLIGEKLFFVSAYPWLKKGAKDTRDMLFKIVRERQANLLVIDGLRSIRDLWQDEAMLREFLYELSAGMATADCVTLYVTEYALARLMELPEATTVDGIISVSTAAVGSRRLRRLEVVKLRGRANLPGEHAMTIDSNGIAISPRLESITEPQPIRSEAPRMTFGLPELDKLLGGGLPSDSTTLVAGSTGIGKTLLGTYFVAAARDGQPGLIQSFFEPAESLVARAERIGIPVQRAIDDKIVQVEYRPPLEWEADRWLDDVLRQIRTHGIRRLLIDGITGLQSTIADPGRVESLLTALVIQLRGQGVTTIFTKEVSKLAGPEIDFSDTPISVAIENFIFMRHVELRGKLHRVISVLKMRDSAYDPDVREFTIAEEGLRVLEPIRSAEGLLTGLARPLGATVAAGRSESE